MAFPEGWVLLVILFGFPYLIARKNKVDFEQVIQAYMRDTELLLLWFVDKLELLLYHVTVFYRVHILLQYQQVQHLKLFRLVHRIFYNRQN